jgi:hypothetical protein
MRTIRRKNWFLKRVALGFAVAAFVAPAAQARVDAVPLVQAHTYQPVQAQSYQPFITDFPSVQANGPQVSKTLIGWPGVTPKDYALSRGPMPHDPALYRGEPIVVVHAEPVASRFGTPNASTTTELGAVDWTNVAIGAGLALALVLLGGGALLVTRQAGREQTA